MNVGDNKFTLPASVNGLNTIYICRLSSNKWNGYVKSIEVTRPVNGTISASGWNTFSCAYPLDLSTIAGGTVYYASAASGSTVTLSSTTATVSAGEGLMINGTEGATFTIQGAESGTTIDDNKLVGLPNGGTVTKNDNNYVFGWSEPASPGFYYINSTEPVLGAGKAYLHTDSKLTEGRLTIVFDGEGDVTGIAEVSTKKHFTGDFYNLNGQKVSQPTKGLYIVNGKKVIIK